jgi:hypothetical protein
VEGLSQRLSSGILGDLAVIYLLIALLLLCFYIFDDLEWSQSGEEAMTLRSLLGRTTIALFWPLMLPAAMYLVIFNKNGSSVRAWGVEITKVLASFAILFGANFFLLSLLQA